MTKPRLFNGYPLTAVIRVLRRRHVPEDILYAFNQTGLLGPADLDTWDTLTVEQQAIWYEAGFQYHARPRPRHAPTKASPTALRLAESQRAPRAPRKRT